MNREESIIFAEKLVEDIISFYGFNLEVKATADDEVIQLSIPSSGLNSILIGRKFDNLRSLQHIVSMALLIRNAEINRVNIDVADTKKQRALQISEKSERWIKRVRETGEPFKVGLNPADRRIVHKTAQDYSDIETHSEGEGRERILIISKK